MSDFQLHVLVVFLGSYSLAVAFRFLRPFFRFQVFFRNGSAVPIIGLNVNDDCLRATPPCPRPPLLSHPLFRVIAGNRTQDTCVLVPFLLFLLSYL